MQEITIALLVSLLVVTPGEAAERSYSARNEFKRINPCPSTSKQRGACPGYVIDHVIALSCGGPDTPANMQWQTIAEAKAKDRWERIGCK